MDKLREFERPAFKEEIRFRGLKNPAYAKEKETMTRMREELLMRTTTAAPGTRRPDAGLSDLITPGNEPTPGQAHDLYVHDPFSHLRNKEKGGELIKKTIDEFFIEDGKAAEQSGLDQEQCRKLAHRVYDQLRGHRVDCEDYTETNFDTSFGIYRNRQTDQVDVAKLKNFVMCLTEL